MAKTAKSPKRKPSLLEIPFRALVRREQSCVEEVLQLWGDFPDCNTKVACSMDWQHALMSQVTDTFEQTRLNESDPEVIKLLRVGLARIVATCEAWEKALMSE